jgi:DNA processing protein
VARGTIAAVLALSDEDLIGAIGGVHAAGVRDELRRFDPAQARQRSATAGLEVICRCDDRYPARLLALDAPPAVLHVAGGLERFLELVALDPVAIVGSRKASTYGVDVARSLARGLAVSGVAVLSGMALGADSAAHAGALEGGGQTVAVLPGSADRAYPASKRGLLVKIRDRGAAISELPPGASVWRWMFPARNRIIAALAALTVVVEASQRSGALLTAGIARSLGRPIGAVPGRVTAPLAAGPNRLIASGAHVIRGPQDVLDVLFGAGARSAASDRRAPLHGELSMLLSAIAEGAETSVAFARAGLDAEDGLAALAELELSGYVHREQGGRFSVVP